MIKTIDRTQQVESALKYLKEKVEEIQDHSLKITAKVPLANWKFAVCPGSKGGTNHGHHAYDGGLAVHTSEVMEIALGMANAQGLDVDKDALMTAIVWHDYGKIFDYGDKKEDGSYEILPHYTLVRHLSRSYAEFMITARDYALEKEKIDKIGHIILAHHGRQTWGSPVEPILTEAFIIHSADHTSAQCRKDYYIRD